MEGGVVVVVTGVVVSSGIPTMIVAACKRPSGLVPSVVTLIKGLEIPGSVSLLTEAKEK